MKRKIYLENDGNNTLRVCLVGKIRENRVLVEEEFGMNLHETTTNCLSITNEYERTDRPKNRGFVRRVKEVEQPTEEQDWYYNND